MKPRHFLSLALLVPVLFSCVRETPESVETEPVAGEDVQSAEAPSYVKVLFSEEMISLIEDDLRAGKTRTRSEALNDVSSELGVETMERLFPFAGEYEPRTRREGLHRWYKVSFSPDVPLTRALDVYALLDGVEWVEPPVKARRETNDPRWNSLWGLNNPSGYDVDVEPVWNDYTVGNPDVVVAVIDGGIDLTHPDLAWNCLPSGHQSYVRGYEEIRGESHGTHVAGTIAGVGNNALGVVGVAGGDYAQQRRGVSLLSQQCFVTSGSRTYSGDFETALKEAADKGALIASNSWGYDFDDNEDGSVTGAELEQARYYHEHVGSFAIAQSIDYFTKYAGCDNDGNQLPGSLMKGGLVVFAAGNENIPYGAPSNYEPCLAVGAMTRSGARAYYSNYGEWVDLCAPGSDILSTIPGSSYTSYSGTSMACPHVSGVAALVVSYFGGAGFTADDLRTRLIEGARDIGLSGTASPIGPLVDAYGAFMTGDSGVPGPVSDFTVSPAGHNLRFSFEGGGGAYGYMVLAAKSEEALRTASLIQPGSDIVTGNLVIADSEAPMEPRTMILSGLEPNTRYYTSVVAYSYSRRFSEMTLVKDVQTLENATPTISTSYEGGYDFRQYQTIDIPFEIADPDGDPLTVSFQTDGRASFVQTDDGLWHFRLSCQAVRAPASCSATLVVVDELGARSLRSFKYSVAANVAPVLTSEFAPVILAAAGQTVDVDLTPHFSDEDGEKLDYRINSLDTKLLGAELVEDGRMRITALGSRGVGEVRVAAYDAMGESVRSDLSVLVRPAGEKVTVLEGTLFSDKLTLLCADSPAHTRVQLIASSGAVAARAEGEFSAFSPVILNTQALAPGLYTLSVDIAGEKIRKTLLKQ